MYEAEIKGFSDSAVKKLELQRNNLPGYLIHGALAGAYVGISVVLILVVGAPLAQASSPATAPAMGASFGIALTLVLLAGSDLFTGNNLTMTIAVLERKIGLGDLLSNWGWTWAGNLLGSVLLAGLVVGAGVFDNPVTGKFLAGAAAKKMALPFWNAFLRGILCNWLVCLAVWSSYRAKSEAVKCVVIFWCLFAFITSGYEHSVANMTLLTMALMVPHGPEISLAGWFANLVPVTLGNVLSGAVFVGAAYWFVSRPAGGGICLFFGNKRGRGCSLAQSNAVGRQ